MAEWMADVFIELVNRSIAASWLVLAVLVLRLYCAGAPDGPAFCCGGWWGSVLCAPSRWKAR